MKQTCTMIVNGKPFQAQADENLLVALMNAGMYHCRTSVRGTPRGAVCGMGTCFECRVEVDGLPQQRACQMTCRDGMRVHVPKEDNE